MQDDFFDLRMVMAVMKAGPAKGYTKNEILALMTKKSSRWYGVMPGPLDRLFYATLKPALKHKLLRLSHAGGGLPHYVRVPVDREALQHFLALRHQLTLQINSLHGYRWGRAAKDPITAFALEASSHMRSARSFLECIEELG